MGIRDRAAAAGRAIHASQLILPARRPQRARAAKCARPRGSALTLAWDDTGSVEGSALLAAPGERHRRRPTEPDVLAYIDALRQANPDDPDFKRG